ncbi:HAD family phosphatase [Prochlorococcus sp. MIT 1223]|uniref:HAD family hydrolase n=1 Tax=Prochlorococcus sp. MIT 1223 TaxID=3096217 RepID=UPI002A7645FB|nr:HAD family phosphatase [Prochlorococcus sp. MIT 1223]
MFFPKAILFDLDGVLLDTEPLHGKAWKETASSFGTELNNKQLLSLQGRRRTDCAVQLLNWIPKPLDASEILEVHKPISKRLLKEAKAMPGARDLVNWCFENKCPIALVTSSTSISVKNKISPHPWLNCFLARVEGDDPSLREGKPFPDPYLLGARKLEANPKKCWAIEDSISGSQSALAAGCQVWILKNSLDVQIKSQSDSNPKYINHLSEVLKELKKLNEFI